MTTRTDRQSKRIISLVLSVVLICISFLALQNSKVVETTDKMVLLEKKHPGYWNWLHNGNGVDFDGNGQNDVSVYSVSKMYKNGISDKDYQIFLRSSARNDKRRVVYFLDGTGIDVDQNIYGYVDTYSWTISDGKIFDWKDIKYEGKPFNKVTDIYEYLTELKNYSFIISVSDEAAGAWNEKLQQLLEKAGLNGGFKYRDSYVAVVEDGKVVCEQVSHAPLEYKKGNVYVSSAGFDTGRAGSIISIDDIDYSMKGRGLNIVALVDGNVIDSVAFDTCDRFLKAIRK